jgi:hypothetical protein
VTGREADAFVARASRVVWFHAQADTGNSVQACLSQHGCQEASPDAKAAVILHNRHAQLRGLVVDVVVSVAVLIEEPDSGRAHGLARDARDDTTIALTSPSVHVDGKARLSHGLLDRRCIRRSAPEGGFVQHRPDERQVVGLQRQQREVWHGLQPAKSN